MQLIFVYNANSGKANAILDSMHKIVSPSTYDCKLCELTFGTFSEKNVWGEFRKNASVEMDFLHKDEFQKEYGSKSDTTYNFPVVLKLKDRQLEVFVSAEEFVEIKSPESLISLIQERLSHH